MVIGKLKKRIELQQLSELQDDYGQMKRGWSTYTTVWASIEPLSGREIETAKQINAEITHKIIIRFQANTIAENRVFYRNRIFDIEAVLNFEEKNEYLVLMCKEVK